MKKPFLTILLIAIVLALASTYLLGSNSLQLNRLSSSVSPAGDMRYRGGVFMDEGVSMSDMAMSEKALIAPMPPIGGGTDAMTVTDRAVEYNSYHSLIVTDVAGYTKTMRDFITSVNGQVLNSSQGKSDSYDYASLYAKVPVANFDQTTQKITENTKKIINESINTADRTGQVVNQQEQLEKTKSELAVKEAELAEATSASARARIQIEISNIQRRITSLEQQAANTQQQVDYATVQITVANKENYFNPGAELSIMETIKEAIRSLRGSLFVIIVIGIWAAVYSVILIPLYLIIKWVKNRFSKRAENKKS